MTSQTRFKLAVGLLVLYLVEGIVKALLPSFPIEVVVGAQGGVVVYYFTVKTVNNNSYNKLQGVRSTNETSNP